jgi:hypothetical protein
MCLDADVVAEREYENLVWDRLSAELVEERFTGRLCVVYEAGYRAALILLDGVAFGACLEGVSGTYYGEEALNMIEALGGPALVKLCPRQL